MIFLQVETLKKLPTFNEIIEVYGPYLGLLLILIVAILFLQFFWFKRILKYKDNENRRLLEREQTLNDRILYLIDKGIGYREEKDTNKDK